jgi:trehalose 6-phosphate phosphatase
MKVWPTLLERLKLAKRILLLSDYDGTLTPIVERPELADISENTRRLLQELLTQRRLTIGIISGRALADLKDKVNIAGLIYAGNHGYEIEGPGLSFVNPLADEIRPFFRIISRLLSLGLETTRGVFVENKGLTLSVHYRQMSDQHRQDLKNVIRRVVDGARSRQNFRITQGKKVYEFRPDVDWDKGQAIKLLMRKYARANGNKQDILPIYLGDDVTDEDGFSAIGEFSNGIAIRIGNGVRKTSAHYYLKTPDEVNEFLRLFLEYSRRGFK